MDNPPVVLITGASSGIGAATARLLGSLGYRVALAARRIAQLESITQAIQSQGGQAMAIQADISQPADIEAMVSTIISEWGQVDILVNNAGFGRLGWLETLQPTEDIQAQIATNLTGTILTSRAVLPQMITRRQGHIINIASVAGWVGSPTYTIYAATKFGVRGFSDALRREVGIHNIHVSVLYPGAVETEFKEKSGANRRKTGLTTPRALVLSSDQLAQAIYTVIKKPRRAWVLPWVMNFPILAAAWFPGLTDRSIERRFVIPERKP